MVKRKIIKGWGVDTINPSVDVLNYMMLKYGQPMHAFDLDKVVGSINVRNAVKGEKLLLLNHQEITFHGDELVIADGEKILALAGVMGRP